jgi:hypothetical protein
VSILIFESGVEEEVCQRLGTPCINCVVFAADFVNNRDGELLNPVLKILLGNGRDGVGIFRFWLIEGAVDNDCWGSNASSRYGVFVSCDTKKIIISVGLSGGTEFSGRGVG